MAHSLQLVDSLLNKMNSDSKSIPLPRRIVRFYTCSDDHNKSEYDASNQYYGILEDNQQAVVGTTVSLLNYSNIYDPSSYKSDSNKKKKIGKLLPPIDAVNIFCIGLNYKFHADESQMSLPKYP